MINQIPSYTLDVLGETDWKVMAIDVTDPLADQLNGNTLIHFMVHLFRNFSLLHKYAVLSTTDTWCLEL